MCVRKLIIKIFGLFIIQIFQYSNSIVESYKWIRTGDMDCDFLVKWNGKCMVIHFLSIKGWSFHCFYCMETNKWTALSIYCSCIVLWLYFPSTAFICYLSHNTILNIPSVEVIKAVKKSKRIYKVLSKQI